VLRNVVLRGKGAFGWAIETGGIGTRKHELLRRLVPTQNAALLGKAEDNFPPKFAPLSPPTQGARVWGSLPKQSRDILSSREVVRAPLPERSTLMFIENRRAFSVHLFHFCEFLVLAHGLASQTLADGADSVGQILIPNFSVAWRGAFHDFNVKLLEAVFPNAAGRVLDRSHLYSMQEPAALHELAVVDMQAPALGGCNKLWYSFTHKDGVDGPSTCPGLGPDTTEDLVRRVRRKFGIATRNTSDARKVGIIRRKGVRSLSDANFDDLVRAVGDACRGQAEVEVVRFENLSLEEQLAKDAELDVLIGVHGAGLTHGLFLDRGSMIVEIMPAGARDWCYQMVAHLGGHEHACWFGGEGFVHRPWQSSRCDEATRDVNHGAECDANTIADRVKSFLESQRPMTSARDSTRHAALAPSTRATLEAISDVGTVTTASPPSDGSG